jgi:predicted 2-oxoglutarate/Fe(II)-dependent dioxygenase YbiX
LFIFVGIDILNVANDDGRVVVNGAFAPVTGASEWWVGDGNQFPCWHASLKHAAFVLIPNVLSSVQCKLLVDCFEAHQTSLAPVSGDAYWDGRYIFSDQLPVEALDAHRIMQQVRHLSTHLLMQRFSPNRVIYSDTAQLVRWHEGLQLTPHADNLEPDGRPNGTPHRSHASILYLNDDYEGGHTFFPGYGVRIKPEPGTLLLFGAGPEHVHGITPVVSGLRYTYAGWFTHDATREECTARVVY